MLEKPTLLLHVCCAPCVTCPLELLNDKYNITIYFYNPNTYPIDEYEKRLKELKTFINDFYNEIEIIEGNYNPNDFYNSVQGLEQLGEKSRMCYECYKLRLEKVAEKASGYDYFSTTLSISPHKNAYWINEIGKELEKRCNVKYLYADFKKNDGYKKSIHLSKKYNLYRQDYCGCEFSKQ